MSLTLLPGGSGAAPGAPAEGQFRTPVFFYLAEMDIQTLGFFVILFIFLPFALPDNELAWKALC